jgi:hypothetical protein
MTSLQEYLPISLSMPESAAPAWRARVSVERGTEALRVAQEVAARLCFREQVDAAVALAQAQTTLPNSMFWRPASVAQGYAGLALVCSYLDACFPGELWDVVGHQYLELAVPDLDAIPNFPLGIHEGLSGLALTTLCLSRQGKRYRTLQARLDALLAERVPRVAAALATQHGAAEPQYDLISGAAGIGAYLLCRPDHPGLAAALTDVLGALIALSGEVAGLPRWHTPVHLLMDQKLRPSFPYGNLNCGLAHGIPGPLATLALALGQGIQVEGLAAAVDTLARWLVTHRADDAWGINWPTMVAIPSPNAPGEARQDATPHEAPSRAAWCYGAPGVARALWLAGRALGRADYCEMSIAAMEAVYRKPHAARMVDSPLLCHGVAGLLQVTLRFAHDTGLPLFTEAAETLLAQVLSLYEPETPVGYRRFEPGGARVPNPALLDGAGGVVLTLLAAATTVEPVCDRLFLLA